MAQTNINISMDEGLKQEFEWMCAESGLDIAAAFSVFAKAVVRGHPIPLDLAMDTPNAETLDAIEEVRRMKKDPSLGKGYTDVDQMMRELLS